MPLKPNTNCFGVDQLDCAATSTDNKCWLVNTSIYRSKFSVGVATSASGGATISSKGTVQQFRKSTNTVVKNISNDRKAATGSDVTIASGTSTRLTALVRGWNYACGIDVSGKPWCWGLNTSGQLGNGNTTSSNIPVPVAQGAIPAGVTINAMAATTAATCAVASNGNMYCWGGEHEWTTWEWYHWRGDVIPGADEQRRYSKWCDDYEYIWCWKQFLCAWFRQKSLLLGAQY